MGNVPPGMGGEGGPPGGNDPANGKGDGKDGANDKKKKKRFEPRPRTTGQRRKRRTGPSGIQKIPTVVPTSKCKLRMMKL